MKGLIIATVAILAVWSRLWGLEPERYTGEIIFKDGSKVVYDWLNIGEELPYSGDFTYVVEALRSGGGPPSGLRKVRLSTISRIDFIDFAKSEEERMRKIQISPQFRKSRITFHDGTVYDNIYLYCFGTWKSSKESGNVLDRNVRSITVNIKKPR